MVESSAPIAVEPRALPAGRAWLRAAAIVGLLWCVLGGGLLRFRRATGRRPVRPQPARQRTHGETIRDLGWRALTRPVAIVIGVLYGAAWTVSSYLRGGDPLPWSWERPVMALIGLLLAFGEELAVRGFLMEQLRRGRVPTWVQVVISAVIMGAYHGVIGASYSVSYGIASAVLFGLVSVIFVIGKRSLTPGYIAHAMTHAFGDPVLIQTILFGVQAT